jgi:dehydrogenase/reductase SDR family protein 7B
MSVTLKSKVVWITGASSGIGEAMALALASEGSQLILSARRQGELERVKEKCLGLNQIKVHILLLDLEDASSLEAKAKEAEELFGHVDILINNGGISQRDKIINTDLSVHRKLMEVNYFGSIALSKYLLPNMIKRKTGHHVVITSAVGIVSTPFRSGYAASKHALHGWYDALRSEHYDDKIHVSLICPGYIRTNISYNALMGNGEKQDSMDNAQENGMAPEKFARLTLKAIKSKKEEVYIGGFKEKLGIYVKRYFPKVFSIMVRKMSVT